MVRMRAFRAIDDIESSISFAEGHRKVLTSYGINQVTSADLSWLENPGVYVIVIEALSDKRILGGTRIHVANDHAPLPMEVALGTLDPKVYDLVASKVNTGAGELCGLWTARDASGFGFSILLTDAGVAEAGIALAQQLRLGSLYVLCAPWTVKMAMHAGFVIEDSVGKNGTFMYPMPDLIATLLVLKDMDTLTGAEPEERERIMDLRMNPKQKKIEKGPKGHVEIEYDLFIPQKK